MLKLRIFTNVWKFWNEPVVWYAFGECKLSKRTRCLVLKTEDADRTKVYVGSTWYWLILSMSPMGTLLAQSLWLYLFGSANDAKLRSRIIPHDLRKRLRKLIGALFVIEDDTFYFVIYMLYKYGNLALVAILCCEGGVLWSPPASKGPAYLLELLMQSLLITRWGIVIAFNNVGID